LYNEFIIALTAPPADVEWMSSKSILLSLMSYTINSSLKHENLLSLSFTHPQVKQIHMNLFPELFGYQHSSSKYLQFIATSLKQVEGE